MSPLPGIELFHQILQTILQAHERRFLARETRTESPTFHDADDFDLSVASDLPP